MKEPFPGLENTVTSDSKPFDNGRPVAAQRPPNGRLNGRPTAAQFLWGVLHSHSFEKECHVIYDYLLFWRLSKVP